MVRMPARKTSKEQTGAAGSNQHGGGTNSVSGGSVRKRHQKPRIKRVSWRDEQIQNMSVGEIDPAILCVRERVVIRYTREQLWEIAKNPASKSKPDFLDPNEVCASILDPEKWNLERKKSDTPDAGPKGGDNGENRRRPGDPRERIKKENDGIVLSPQRRSFNSGCFVPANKESTLTGKGDAPPTHLIASREISASTRRIGSGRIMRDAWESEKDSGEPDFNFGRNISSRNNERDEKFGERRSFGRESDNGGKEKDNRRNTRYSEGRRRYSDTKEEEPEWFSSGPMSQNDTIELRGFDESDKPGKRKMSAARVKRVKDWSKKKESTIAEDKEKTEETPESNEPLPSNGQQAKRVEAKNNEPDAKLPQVESSSTQPEHQTFDFDEFFKGEHIPGLLTNGVSEDAEKTTSRFSRWFKKDSPTREVGGSSRKSSIQDDNHIIKDLLKDINESSSIPVAIHPPPIDSNTYFAPISPAGNSCLGVIGSQDKTRSSFNNTGQPVNIMELLGRGKQPQQPEGWNSKPQGSMVGSGKILSLDELESRIRQSSDHSANSQPKAAPQKPDEEMTAAFKRLLQQAGGHSMPQNGPMNKPPGMSLLEMLSHSQQQDEARLAAAQAAAVNQHSLHSHQPQQSSMHNDLMLKLQQAQLQQQQQKQLDMLGKLMSGGNPPHMRTSPLLDLGVQQSRELLNRPEAQAILQGLKRGEITIQHLYQQIANPALQPRHRDMLTTIVKLHSNSASYGPSPRVLSPVPMAAHHLYPPQAAQMQQQQLAVSPLPPNAYCVSPIMATSPNQLAVPAMHQRIPSPRELQVHTQNILQRALIKKKLEEQSENYRKKQEMQRGTSPNMAVGSGSQHGKGMSSPTPLAFTPTSVLRKMTAEKEEGKENKVLGDNGMKPPGRPLTGMRTQPQVNVGGQQWNQPFPMKQAGRPIVKANNYQSQTPDQFFAQLASQQQPLPQQRTYQNLQNAGHMKPIIGQQYSIQQSSMLPAARAAPSLGDLSRSGSYGPSQPQYSPHPNPQQPSFPQPTAQQLRAQHQHRPSGAPAPSQPQADNQPANQQPDQSQQSGTAAWQQFLNSPVVQQQKGGHSKTGNQQSGPFSPTTADQLTRWFSPDLLERARGGELPSTANLARLEEIERQAAPPVHN